MHAKSPGDTILGSPGEAFNSTQLVPLVLG